MSALLFSAGLIAYTYVVYPLLIAAAGAVVRRKPKRLNGNPRKVSVIMAVHNGAKWLPAKIASLKAQDYPAELVEIVVVSDGSNDATDELLDKLDVTWTALPEPSGKPSALNRAVAMANGQVLVFTDVRQPLSANAVSALAGALTDPKVGVAGGELVMGQAAGGDAGNVGLYWRYEKWIRGNESKVHSTAGASGALYAIRRDDFEPIPTDTLLDDFDIPIKLLRKRQRIALISEARAFDQAESDAGAEQVRKIRTLAGNFQSFGRHKWLFNPFQNPIFIQFISHKVLRLLIPYAMLVFFLACIILREWWATLLALLQVFGLVVAWLAASIPEWRERSRVLSFVHTFTQLNGAAVIAAVRYFSSRLSVSWRTSKRA